MRLEKKMIKSVRLKMPVYRASQLFRLLADESRLRLLFVLAEGGELDTRSLAEMVAQSPSIISRHMLLLRMAGVVVRRRQGRNTLYSLASNLVRELLDRLRE